MHAQCAVWSHGVVKTKKEEETPAAEGAVVPKSPSKESLCGLEKSVVNAMYQKCNHCRHFGASMKCRSSGKFYHYPCGAASGSYMQRSPNVFVGHDNLAKVANLGELERERESGIDFAAAVT